MIILLISILIALIIVIFAVQNALSVPVQFLVWSADLPLVLVIFCSVFAGALLMFCLALWRDLKSQVKKRSKKETTGQAATGKLTTVKSEQPPAKDEMKPAVNAQQPENQDSTGKKPE